MAEPRACAQCGTVYDPDDAYKAFVEAFKARLGWTFTGHRPRWLPRFCSEPCRYADLETRTAAQTVKTARRKAAERANR